VHAGILKELFEIQPLATVSTVRSDWSASSSGRTAATDTCIHVLLNGVLLLLLLLLLLLRSLRFVAVVGDWSVERRYHLTADSF